MRAISLIGIVMLAALSVSASDTNPAAVNTQLARQSPEWLTGGVMYQIQPRAFTPEGTLKAAEARLPKLTELVRWAIRG